MSSFLQSHQWARFREQMGWKTHWLDTILVLERPLPLGKSFLYVPEAQISKLDIRELVGKIRKTHWVLKPIFLRLEILDEESEQSTNIKELKKLGFIKSFEEVQPEWRQIIDLNQPEEQLLAQMKPKGRYNISVAKRHGVMVNTDNQNQLKTFYHLYQLTTERAKVSSRILDYFIKLQSFFPKESQIFIACYKNQPLAAALVIFWHDTATYLYGGSSTEHKEVMAPYLLHWEIMKEAKKRGCRTYDMGAVSPMTNDEFQNFRKNIRNSNIEYQNQDFSKQIKREQRLTQKYAGITRFKQQFGGQTVHIIGSYDLIFKPVWYMLFRFVEMFRR